MLSFKEKTIALLRWSEKYTKTDMVYLLKGGFWLNANAIIVSAFSFALSIAFASLVSKETYGIYQFALSLSAIVGGLTLTGMNTAVTQAVARGFEGVFPKSVRVQIKYGIIPFLAGLALSLYYLWNQNSDISISLIVIAIALPITNALNTWVAFLSGKKAFKDLFRYSQIVNFIYYFGIIGAMLLVPHALVLILINFALNALANLISYKLIMRKHRPNQNFEEEAIDFGKKFSLSNILPMIAINADNIVIFHFLGAASLAVYAFASNIPDRLGGLLKPVSALAFPKFAEKSGSPLSELYEKTWRLFVLSLAGGLIYIALAPLIFKIFFPAYLDSVQYSQAYALVSAISATAGLPMVALYAKRIKHIHLLNVSYPVLNVALLALGGSFYGIPGVIAAKVVSSLLLLSGSLYLNRISREI